MSIKAVKDFYEKFATDKDFQKKLDELQKEATEGLELPLAQDKKEEIIKDVIIPFAKEQGFDFSIEDIKEFEQSIIEQLDEKQLENIAAALKGLGHVRCYFLGLGFGVIGGYDYTECYGGCSGNVPFKSGGFCIMLGFGECEGVCLGSGESM